MQEARAVVLTDDLQTTTTTRSIAPELLIEEARQHRRRRQRREAIALVALGILAVLGIAVTGRLGGGGTASVQHGGLALAVASKAGVVFEKVEIAISTPHVATMRRTGELWFSPAAPWAYREFLTIPGRRTFEVGARPVRDPRFGSEQVVYLYDAGNNTIYRTGANLVPGSAPSARTAFRRLLAQPGTVLVGTRMFEGHKVYVARRYGSTSIGNTSLTMYIDTTTYQPLLSVETGPDFRSTVRILVYKALPATTANLKLTSLARSHAGARVRAAPPSIDTLYGKSSRIGTFGGSDLGPVAGG